MPAVPAPIPPLNGTFHSIHLIFLDDLLMGSYRSKSQVFCARGRLHATRVL